MSYRVEQSTVDLVRDTRKVRMLPKVYKTWRGADKAARRLNWVVSPDGRTRVFTSAGRVIEKA